MNYIEYKKMAKYVVSTGNPDAMCYFFETCDGHNGEDGYGLINDRIKSYKYTHADLTKDEMKELFKLNKLNDDDILIGGEIHRVVCNIQRKELILTQVNEIDLFTILHQIHLIKTKNIDKLIYNK